MLFGYAMPISGIGFYGKHARDLPQKEGFGGGGGGIMLCCFLVEESACRFDL
jgi:hypothetical protein